LLHAALPIWQGGFDLVSTRRITFVSKLHDNFPVTKTLLLCLDREFRVFIVKYKAAFLILFSFAILGLLAVPVQAESGSRMESNAALAKPTKKPAKTKKPKSTPIPNNTATPVPTSTATLTSTAVHTSNPAFSPTASLTPSSTGTATNTPTPTNTAFLPDEPAKTKPAFNATSTVPAASVTAFLSPSASLTAASTITPAPGLTPMFAGGLAVTMPSETPATPWLQTVVAAVTQTEMAAPTASLTSTSTVTVTPTIAATSTGFSTTAVNVNAPLNVGSVPIPAPGQNNNLFWMMLYSAGSLGFVVMLFIGYLRWVVFRAVTVTK
jgi:hypothetical protein